MALDQTTPSPIRRALASCRGAIAATAGFSLFGNLLLFVSPLYMLQVYDRVLSSRSGSTLLMLTLIAGFLLAVLGIIEAVRSRVLVRAGARLDRLLASATFAGVFETAVKKPGAGGGQVLRDLDSVRDFATGPAILVFCDAPWAPLFIAVAFLLHPLLGLVTLVGAVAIFALAVINEVVTRKALKDSAAVSFQAGGFAEASLRNAEVLHAMGMMPQMAKRWLLRHDTALALQARAADRAGTLLAVSKFVRLFLQSAILGVGAWLALDDAISGGAIVAASIIMGRALAPIEMAVGHWKGFVAARGAFARLGALLAETDAGPARLALPRPKGAVALERVFAVPPGSRTAVLKGVSFAIEAGEVLGIVGPSAAGKSTLARVMVGVWPAGAGTVRLDGADLATLPRDQVGPALGYLPQDVELFDGTVAENIARFGDIDAAKVVEAATKAGVHEVILSLSDGYDTRIGESGRALSGGQRQRVALARALYDDPALVVLDEPNSNLDTAGEQALVEAVGGCKARGATTIVVTHRLSILATVDKILVLNAGEVELFGSRDEVMARLARPQVVAAQAGPKAVAAAAHS
ncbi:type I secretion system permease/ATPase [Magnetospirillum sp. UT-4]|uniref:type I secretion system permease/ATPase n=1 Tax=Magnetospirillum sp. UT-4 TaxID=2681467 RepID=UPI0013829306|nr:type I secretion system permease/ATPase [Magnetospirillum sp. UT-4]CAA7625497.1 Alkaline protease secretion ATP-binding protein AprD [Magnetospirillum sp. UT-4]